MRHRIFTAAAIVLVISAATALPAIAAFDIVMGDSWDGVSLQSILDAEYGPGTLDVATDYEGYSAADADPPYWEDLGLDGVIVREIAGYSNRNVLGWHEETGVQPVINGIGDGIIFTGPMSEGQVANIPFGSSLTFGFYLDPNGDEDGRGAPQGEHFFANRFYNDIGPDGGVSNNPPDDGDPQVLIFNITHLRQGIPTYVLAWEDIDYGLEIHPFSGATYTDNDFQDLVVEVSAFSPVPNVTSSWGSVKALYEE